MVTIDIFHGFSAIQEIVPNRGKITKLFASC